MGKRLVEMFCEMVRIDSESGDEACFLQYLKELIEREVQAHCLFDSYGNLIARVPQKASSSNQAILLVAHADTVKPGQGIEPIIENGIIRSAGETILGADDKAGIAEIIEAVRAAKKHPPVEIVITRQEETGLLGAKNLDISMLEAKQGFVVDFRKLNAIVVGGPTYIAIDIDIKGKAAHAGMEPEEGISAIRVAAEAIARIPEGRIDEETTANVGTIHGGMVRNSVPERAAILAECRSLDHNKCLRQAAIVKRTFEEEAEKAGAKVDVQLRVDFRATRIPENAPVVRLAEKAITTAGLEPESQVINGGTDAFILTERGIESVVIGSGSQGSHTTEECIAISDMEKATEIIRQLLYLSTSDLDAVL